MLHSPLIRPYAIRLSSVICNVFAPCAVGLTFQQYFASSYTQGTWTVFQQCTSGGIGYLLEVHGFYGRCKKLHISCVHTAQRADQRAHAQSMQAL